MGAQHSVATVFKVTFPGSLLACTVLVSTVATGLSAGLFAPSFAQQNFSHIMQLSPNPHNAPPTLLPESTPRMPAARPPASIGMPNAGINPSMNPQNLPPTGSSGTIQIQATTKKVPRGTVLKIAFITPMDSATTPLGMPFNAWLSNDFTIPNITGVPQVILAKGTVVRGRVNLVKRPGLFSKGGTLGLDFDHIVLPTGELTPLDLDLSTDSAIVSQEGLLYSDPGINAKLSDSMAAGGKTFENILDKGASAPGAAKILTVPAAAVGGALAGVGVATGQSIKSIVGRGDSVVIQPGDTMQVDFSGAFTMPAE